VLALAPCGGSDEDEPVAVVLSLVCACSNAEKSACDLELISIALDVGCKCWMLEDPVAPLEAFQSILS